MIHGYIRVSTDEQVNGTSPADQERRILMVVAAMTNGGVPEEMWSDLGVSGAIELSTRSAGAQMLARLRAGDVVVAAKLDRLFRNAEDALTQSRQWREQSVDLILIDMGLEPVTTSAAGRMYFGMLAQFAEFERERIIERTRDGRAAKLARGGYVGGNAPIGYKAVGSGKDAILIQDREEINLIKRTHELAPLYNNSPTRIAERLNNEGHRSRKGRPFVAVQILRFLNIHTTTGNRK